MMNRLNITFLSIRLIGIYQLLFGLLGLTFTFREGANLISNYFMFFVVFVVVFSFSVYCGVLLLTKQLVKGIRISTINQLLQIVQFTVFGISIEYVAGIYFAIGFSNIPTFNVEYKFAAYKSTCFLSYVSNSGDYKIMINIIALLLTAYLYHVYQQRKNVGVFSNEK